MKEESKAVVFHPCRLANTPQIDQLLEYAEGMQERAHVLDQLRQIFESELAEGPFPTKECSVANLTAREQGILELFLDDLAGIASHGRKLAAIGGDRKAEFNRIASLNFAERWPEIDAKITPERTPELFRLLNQTEKARLIIVNYLTGQDADDHTSFSYRLPGA